MNGWMNFWAAWLMISGVAFTGITLIVAIKGFHDLRAMFAGLREKKKVE
jgi:hypothetical protein